MSPRKEEAVLALIVHTHRKSVDLPSVLRASKSCNNVNKVNTIDGEGKLK